MNTFKKWLILIFMVVGAAISYRTGFSGGTWGFIILGAVFELSFWFGLFSMKGDGEAKFN